MKILKYALFALGGLAIAAGAVLAYVAATFDPNQYKPQIVQAVKEKTQRTLKLDGDIVLSFWPSVGAKIGKASLSERESEKEFAALEEAHVSLKLMPLLSKQAVVDTIRVTGLSANLVTAKDGSTNVDDLAGPAAAKEAPGAKDPGPGFKVDVAGVEIEDATIHYTDQAAGTKVTLSKLNLKTGRIAPGVPTRFDLTLKALGDKPRLDVLLKAAGTVMANVGSGEFTASKVSAALTGSSGKDTLDIKLEAPRLEIAANKASGDKLTVAAKVTGPGGTTSANLSLPGIEGTAESFKSSAMTLDLDMKQGELAVTAKLASPVSGNAKTRQLTLPQLKASIRASGPNLPGRSITGELAGSAAVDGAKQSAQANLAGKVADSNVKARLGASRFAPLALNFDIELDQLDVDRFLPPKPAAGPSGTASPSGQKQAERIIDLTGLRSLHANGALRVGALKANNIKASNVRMDVKANGGRVDVNPLTASLYQGTLASAIAINAVPATPSFAVRHKMTGVSVGPLLKDLANNDTLEGKGNVTLDVTTQGGTVGALKKALNGAAAIKLADGAVRGIDIAGSIRSARAKLGSLRGEQSQAADRNQKTDFSELTATFKITNGVARNNDLSLKSPLLRVGGEGEINLGEDTLNYLVKATVVGTTKGQGGREADELKGLTVPVRVAGPLAAPSYKLDFGAMVTETAKQTVVEQVQKRLGIGAAAKGAPAAGDAAKQDGATPGGIVRDKLRGLFGR